RLTVSPHSSRSALTGLDLAARNTLSPTIVNIQTHVTIPVSTNKVSGTSIRYVKFSNHLCMSHQATGKASTVATSISLENEVERSDTIEGKEAPNTFRTPISLTLRSIV